MWKRTHQGLNCLWGAKLQSRCGDHKILILHLTPVCKPQLKGHQSSFHEPVEQRRHREAASGQWSQAMWQRPHSPETSGDKALHFCSGLLHLGSPDAGEADWMLPAPPHCSGNRKTLTVFSPSALSPFRWVTCGPWAVQFSPDKNIHLSRENYLKQCLTVKTMLSPFWLKEKEGCHLGCSMIKTPVKYKCFFSGTVSLQDATWIFTWIHQDHPLLQNKVRKRTITPGFG